jgi:hypothetical protein
MKLVLWTIFLDFYLAPGTLSKSLEMLIDSGSESSSSSSISLRCKFILEGIKTYFLGRDYYFGDLEGTKIDLMTLIFSLFSDATSSY